MNAVKAVRAVAVVLLGASALSVSAAAQMRTAPRPVMQNPNRPQADWQPAPDERFTALAFVVKTGDDDLRGDSSAWVKITFPDRSSQKCDLKIFDQDPWGNNTIHSHDIPQCILTAPKTFQDLKGSDIVLFYYGHGKDGVKTQDNWNVNEVLVRAQDFVSKKYPCLIDAKGSPLVRMQGKPYWDTIGSSQHDDNSDDSFDLTQTPSAC